MNIDTTDKDLAEKFNFFVENIEPHIAPVQNQLDQKLSEVPFLQELGKDYEVYFKVLDKKISLFREENIPLFSKLQVESQKYGTITGAMTIKVEDQEITLQKASLFLKDLNREVRKSVYQKIEDRRSQDAEHLQKLMDELIELRQQVAKNTGHDNFRDYMFEAMYRFYYTKQDCYTFHDSVQKHITPLLNHFNDERKKQLQYSELYPWDLEVDVSGKNPLKPFENSEELVNKVIDSFYQLDADFGDCIALMKNYGYLDLDSKKGKAPGGFNYPLFESGIPFIYMNSVGLLRDLVTMYHEAGHAVHSYLTKNLEITDLKSFPSEVAELASMSMELISMDFWHLFFTNEEDLKRAKKEHLEKVIQALPWIALVDKFQHWLYEHKNHTAEQRNNVWMQMLENFSSNRVHWKGYEQYRKASWLKQLHIFEVPFYYIEYGFAQLGAIAVWKNYKENPKLTIQKYKHALSLGNTRSIPEIYEAAGIQFKFDENYVKELADFVLDQHANL